MVDNGLQPGQLVGGDFRVMRLLGEGGMGSVYVAEQLSTGAQRALKVMHPSVVAMPGLRERFVQEARVGARIESDHIVQVVAAGVDAQTGTPWLAMELLEGSELSSAVAARPLTASETKDIFAQLCHAVGAAHAAGIVHRDLKPENIFLAKSRLQGQRFMVKVLDFGIAKILDMARTRMTSAMGSQFWMAPEQTQAGDLIKPATDVWALGLIAFYLLTGKQYWMSARGDASSGVVLREILMEPIVPASRRAAELGASSLPAGFDAWFANAVCREVTARFADASACFAALAPVLERGAQQGSALGGTHPAQPLPTRESHPHDFVPSPSTVRDPGLLAAATRGPAGLSTGVPSTAPNGAPPIQATGVPPTGPMGPPAGAAFGAGGTVQSTASSLASSSFGAPPAQPGGFNATMLGGADLARMAAQASAAGDPYGAPGLTQGPYLQTPAYGAPPGPSGAVGSGSGPSRSISIPPPPRTGGTAQIRSGGGGRGAIIGGAIALGVIAAAGIGYFALREKPKRVADDDEREKSPRSARSNDVKPPPSIAVPGSRDKVPPPPPTTPPPPPPPPNRDDVTGRMVKIPGGTFMMGLSDEPKEQPLHSVTLQPFEIDITEVTVGAYAACKAAGKCTPAENVVWPGIGALLSGYIPGCNRDAPDKKNHPVNCVDVAQAEAFCAWAGKRLPTEEEWEYAARGGVKDQKFPWGNQVPTPSLTNRCGSECLAMYRKIGFSGQLTYPDSDGFERTSPVGSFPAGASRFGVMDMQGNVWEWTSSPFCPYDRPSCGEAKRTFRGRSWDDYLPGLGVGPDRFGAPPTNSLPSVGFRCAR